MSRYDYFILVDTQPGAGNIYETGQRLPDAVIDHHNLRALSTTIPFNDIRTHYGSTSTIIAEYYKIELELENGRIKKAKKVILSDLDAREREIIVYRYGLEGGKPLTQRELADKLDISRSYVSRLEKSALDKIRQKLTGK